MKSTNTLLRIVVNEMEVNKPKDEAYVIAWATFDSNVNEKDYSLRVDLNDFDSTSFFNIKLQKHNTDLYLPYQIIVKNDIAPSAEYTAVLLYQGNPVASAAFVLKNHLDVKMALHLNRKEVFITDRHQARIIEAQAITNKSVDLEKKGLNIYKEDTRVKEGLIIVPKDCYCNTANILIITKNTPSGDYTAVVTNDGKEISNLTTTFRVNNIRHK